MDLNITFSEGVLASAALLGPIIAVQLTRYLDDRKEVRNRKLQIFRILMATRAANVSPGHVEALNSIDLEFYNKGREKEVRRAWKEYLDHLGNMGMPNEQWVTRRADLLIELLDKMGKSLGYDFDRVEIAKGVYSPKAYGEIENDQEAIRRGFKELLEGKRVVPMHVVNLPIQRQSTPEEDSIEKNAANKD